LGLGLKVQPFFYFPLFGDYCERVFDHRDAEFTEVIFYSPFSAPSAVMRKNPKTIKIANLASMISNTCNY